MSVQLNLDKSKWEPVKLGELATEISVRMENPAEAGVDKFVGLEHFVSGDLKIKSYKTTKGLASATKQFQSGDILFARRNAYLRRASMVDFDGVCSGDAFVLRENHDRVVPGFLAFVVNSEGLWDFANSNAAGTMSKRVKWRDLADYEVLLPPKVQQAEIAELLWAMDEVIQKDAGLLRKTEVMEEVRVKAVFIMADGTRAVDTKLGPVDKGWKCLSLQELLDQEMIASHLDGNHGSYYPRSEEFVDSGVPYISANCIDGDRISLKNAKYLTEERAAVITKGIAQDGDILLAHNATVGPVCVLNTAFEKIILSTTLTYYRVNPEVIDRDYLFYFMKSRLFQSQLERVMSQSTRNQVPITTQRKLLFIIPPIEEQRELTVELKEIVSVRKMLLSKAYSSKSLQAYSINEVF